MQPIHSRGEPEHSWADRILPYAQYSAWGAALGGILCLGTSLIFGKSHGSFEALIPSGFIAGLLIGPIVLKIRLRQGAVDVMAGGSAAATAREYDDIAWLAQLADSLLPYAMATAFGATLACLGGIGIFAVAHGSRGPLSYFCGGGFILGALAGLTLITIYRIFTGMPQQAADSLENAQI